MGRRGFNREFDHFHDMYIVRLLKRYLDVKMVFKILVGVFFGSLIGLFSLFGSVSLVKKMTGYNRKPNQIIENRMD